MMKQILILGLLISNAAFADCDRTKHPKNLDQCSLCYVSKGVTYFYSPWNNLHSLTPKEKTASALNSVMCKFLNPEVFKKSALPSKDSQISDSAIYDSISKIYASLGTSNINSSESPNDRATGCFDVGPFSSKNLASGSELYFAKMLNSCMVRSGGDFKKTYCIDISQGIKNHQGLTKGLVGLLRKSNIINQAQAQDMFR